jgi:outer membrane receptor protein involved in Fe transport
MAMATTLHAAEPGPDEEVLGEVVVTAPYGLQVARDRVPARVQTATTEDIEALQPLDITELLNRGFGSVNINHAQNNPLQPDVNFRGQTASPLLGLAQGLSVYADGVRMNETFGDTVNWDLLPLSAVHDVQLLAGTNPVFGLNSLGGALSLTMKDGFNTTGNTAEVMGGSFGRAAGSLQGGGNNGTWGWYGDLDYFREDGWRDHSHSDALRGHGALGWRDGDDRFDLAYSRGDSKLYGNGASPVELLAEDRKAVFTWPDITQNRLDQLVAKGSKSLGDGLTLSGNLFVRKLRTKSFNGDGTIFEECSIGGGEFLVDEEFDDVDDNGACTGADNYQLVLDQHGDPIDAERDGDELDAINNRSRRNQRSGGGSLQLGHQLDLGNGRSNTLTLGAAWQRGKAGFDSAVEVASLTEDRGTTRPGIYAEEYRTDVDSHVTTWSLYAVDNFDLTSRLSLTTAARFDHSRIQLADQSGLTPELDGSHGFGRVNPAVGLAWRGDGFVLFGNLSQASRAPTAVELACADEDAPCNLPNAFLADPPLKEVVARSIEAGARGELAGLQWELGAFQTVNRDDILFQTTGGALANVGFFRNTGDTRRRGIEVELAQEAGDCRWKLDYSLVDATYRDDFVVNSPNHPLFSDDGDDDIGGADLIVGEGKLLVPSGRHLPGIAKHQANLELDYQATPPLRLGADVEYRSGVYLRGDEINVLGRTSDYALLNVRGEYRFGESLSVFARIENLLDTKYETFGLLGEPDEVFAGFEDPRFYGVGPPRAAWVGLRAKF